LKKSLLLSLLLGLALLAFPTGVQAQEGQGELARYLVQSGDTLWSIGQRFGVSVDDLVEANNLADPNQLIEGDVLVLPGMDWVQGVLDEQAVPYGENLRSLSRRYHVSPQILARLSQISSPAQLSVNYPALLPTQRGEQLDAARALVSSGGTLLEMAVLSGNNPWVVAGANGLQGTWEIIPGDVLQLPGTSQPGPGGLPSAITAVEFSTPALVDGDSRLFQGRTCVLRLFAEAGWDFSGELVDMGLNFFAEGEGSYVALGGIYAQKEPGLYPLLIQGSLGENGSFAFQQLVKVESGGYGFETLTVEDDLIAPALTETELQFVAAITDEASPDKLWSGYFQAPSPYPDTITSGFGTSRSYNGGIYETFHSGVDFGGGLGVQIFAPATGVVVFAGPLDIRGNATIIDHGWGVYTGYWHQSEMLVEVGDVVQPGQVIGIVGNTGRSTGAHLHWEMWVGGVQVNPLDWLALIYP